MRWPGVILAVALTAVITGGGVALAEENAGKAVGKTGKEFVIRPLEYKWEPRAELFATPRLNSTHNYERAVSVPRLATIKLDGIPYIYMAFRVSEYEAGSVLRIARIPADRFSDGLRITPLEQWEWIPADRFRIAPDGDAWPADPSIVGINGMLLIAYKRRGENKPASAVLFDPVSVRIVWQRNLSEIEGYAGPKGTALPSLARVTSSPPNIAGDYLDSARGNVVMTYKCSQTDSAACRTDKGFRDGFYLQSVSLRGETIRMGAPVRLFADKAPRTIRPAEAEGKYPLWHKQNMMAGNLGNDTMVFSVNYNLLAEHKKRPANRDYPCCASFFEVPSLSLILERAGREGFLDLAALIPKEKTWRQDVRADSPWDQGAIWSQIVYIDPFHDKTVFTMYEGWGADYMQPERTRNAFYPGSFHKWVRRGRPAAQKSCNTFCKERKFNGGACFSASVIGPGSRLHGTEIPHDQSLADYIREKDNAVRGALYVCSDLGTRDKDPDFRYVTVSAAADIGEETVAGFADGACKKSASGYIRAELISPQTESRGHTLPGDRKVNPGETLSVTCSTQFDSKAFRPIQIRETETSCDMACDSLGPGNGSGYRPYHAEVTAYGRDGERPLLDGTGVDPDFVLSMQKTLGFDNVKMGRNLSDASLTCICGPGRNLRATMVYRRGRAK